MLAAVNQHLRHACRMGCCLHVVAGEYVSLGRQTHPLPQTEVFSVSTRLELSFVGLLLCLPCCVRVHTMMLPVLSELSELYRAADGAATACLLAKLGVEKSLMAKLEDTRQALLVRGVLHWRLKKRKIDACPPNSGCCLVKVM